MVTPTALESRPLVKETDFLVWLKPFEALLEVDHSSTSVRGPPCFIPSGDKVMVEVQWTNPGVARLTQSIKYITPFLLELPLRTVYRVPQQGPTSFDVAGVLILSARMELDSLASQPQLGAVRQYDSAIVVRN